MAEHKEHWERLLSAVKAVREEADAEDLSAPPALVTSSLPGAN